MISCLKLKGHLGNQIFQIASTIGIAIENNDNAIFKKWKYSQYYTTTNLFNFNNNCIITEKYIEPYFHYKQVKYVGSINLTGYFQSEKYFIHCSNLIKKMFKFKKENELKKKWNKYLIKNTIGIHIRRGDYLKLENYHSIQSLEYYNKAIKIIEKNNNIDYILVFSDDIKWCKKNFKDKKYVFIENQFNTEDLALMSYCNHNVISNSSFSWWASWLNNNTNKIVIAPKKWFGKIKIEQGYITKDIYSKNMIII